MFLSNFMLAQQNAEKKTQNREKLIQFTKQKSAGWKIGKRKADSLAIQLNLPIYYITKDRDNVIILQRLGRRNKPIYYITNNASSAATISVDDIWTNENEYPALTGEGVEINLWDGGSVRSTHHEFQNGTTSRIVMRDMELPLANHSTHIAGTMIASGVNEDAKGMAGKATITAWDLNDDIAEMAGAAADGIVVSNHSYGPICGWYYNANNENWYWYGDLEISETEDYEFGFYSQVSADMDYVAELAPYYLIVKSAGNDRNNGPTSSYVHFVWDGSWQLVDTERELDGGADGYDCLTPMSVAKNILTVGAIDDAKAMTSFSAYGPTDDGRIKPDVVANGVDVFSSISTNDNSYDSYGGTSMSTASATGAIALLHQLQNTLQPGVTLRSSTIKGLLIHTASDLGNSGPDYRFGWGLLNIKEAADLFYTNSNNQGKNIIEATLTSEEEIVIPVSTSGSSPFLKVTLTWIDPAGQPSSPSLNSRNSKLVNDLDISVQNSNSLQTFLPWSLDVENPGAIASKAINHVDNVEQVYIVNPGDNNFNIKISHSGTLASGSQSFSLIISGIETTPNIFPPQNLTFTINASSILLNWNQPETGTPNFYRVYRNGTLLAETTNLTYNDQSITLNNVYQYYVTAVYDINNEDIESIATNQVTAYPQTLRSLTFIVDFETEPTEVLIKNSEVGWQWGDWESLNCYYLDFSDNTSKFIGIDSYSAGEAVHVSDIAITAPLRLADYTNIVLSFDYLLKTGIYEVIDELHVVYKLQEESEWHELSKLEKSLEWTSISIDLPSEMCKNGTQIGFYYDDFYQWGMGAGIDNIQIIGETTQSVDLEINSSTSPVSSCLLSANEIVTVTIKNVGSQTAPPDTSINIQMNVSNGTGSNDSFILSDTLFINDVIPYQLSKSVDMSNPGEYTFEFNLSCSLDVNESNNSFTKVVEVYGLPQVAIQNTDLTFCESDQQVLVEVNPDGGTLSGTGVSGIYFDPSVASVGTHVITYSLTDSNGCNDEVSKEFTVIAIPEPEILNADLTFCEDDQQILIEVAPTGGTLSGTGVSGMYFYPSVAGLGTHVITYSLTDSNSCEGEVSKSFTVVATPEPEILNSDITFCESDQQVLIEVTHTGGTLSGVGVSGMYFNPSAAGVGTHLITYSITDANGCDGEVTKEFTVIETPDPKILNEDLTFCESDQQILIEVNPTGGTLSGTGVSGMYFDPSVAGVGTHLITYSVTDANGCDGEVTKEFTVIETPDPKILNEDLTFCESDQQVLVEVTPTGGTLSGNGVSGMYFDPSIAGVGTHSITYSVNDATGCDGEALKQFTVLATPEPEILNTDLTLCENDQQVLIEVSPSGGTLSGTGVSVMHFYPNQAGPGIHEIYYTYSNLDGCTGTAKSQITVNEAPLVDLGPDQNISIDDNILLTVSGNGTSFLWFDESTENPRLINAEDLGVGKHKIWVVAKNSVNCSAIDSMTLIIDLPDIVHIETSNKMIVYPNPFSEGIYINLNENEIVNRILLFNIEGLSSSIFKTSDFPYFNLSHLPDGIYILKIYTNRRIYNLKITKI